LILNPYNFVPLTVHIKLEVKYSIELDHRCKQEVSLMALNDTFSIQTINLYKKDLLFENKPKKLKLIGITNVKSIQVTTIAKFFVINTLTFRYSYAWFLYNSRTKE